jgi:hypothetical protein
MVDINEDFTEWTKSFETADKATRAAMKRELEKHIERRDAEAKAEIAQAVERLGSTEYRDRFRGEDGNEIVNDVRTVSRGIQAYKDENQILRWRNQILESELRVLGELIKRQLERMRHANTVEDSSLAVLCLDNYVNFYHPFPLSTEMGLIQFIGSRSGPDRIRQKAKERLARLHIHITQSGEMIIEEAARLNRF